MMYITLNGNVYPVTDIEDIDWEERGDTIEDTTGYTRATEFTVALRNGFVEVVHVNDLEDEEYHILLQHIVPT